MIAVDASAICAIYFREPERDAFLERLTQAGGGWVTPLNLWEARVTVARRDPAPEAMVDIDALLTAFGIEVASIGPADGDMAFKAWSRFGKSRHKASLNMGDCFAYALATSHDAPLLYKGDDFARTDIESAL